MANGDPTAQERRKAWRSFTSAALAALSLLLTNPLCAEPRNLLFYIPISPPQGMEEGERKGFMADIALEAARRAGYSAQTAALPWPRTLMYVKKEKNLLIAGLSRFPEREKEYTWISPVFTLWRAFVTTDQQIDSYDEGREELKKIAVHYGSLEESILQGEGFSPDQFSLITTNTLLIDFLLKGRVTALYRPIIEVRWLARDRTDANRLVYGTPLQPTEQYVACSRICDPEIVTRLGKALRAMKQDGTTERIIKSYD
jgi:polar amino acid transport system substrate-binding protein